MALIATESNVSSDDLVKASSDEALSFTVDVGLDTFNTIKTNIRKYFEQCITACDQLDWVLSLPGESTDLEEFVTRTRKLVADPEVFDTFVKHNVIAYAHAYSPNLPWDVKFELDKLKSVFNDSLLTGYLSKDAYADYTRLIATLLIKLYNETSTDITALTKEIESLRSTKDYNTANTKQTKLQELKNTIKEKFLMSIPDAFEKSWPRGRGGHYSGGGYEYIRSTDSYDEFSNNMDHFMVHINDPDIGASIGYSVSNYVRFNFSAPNTRDGVNYDGQQTISVIYKCFGYDALSKGLRIDIQDCRTMNTNGSFDIPLYKLNNGCLADTEVYCPGRRELGPGSDGDFADGCASMTIRVKGSDVSLVQKTRYHACFSGKEWYETSRVYLFKMYDGTYDDPVVYSLEDMVENCTRKDYLVNKILKMMGKSVKTD